MMLVSLMLALETALVQELYQPITAKHGYFISGKFDQFRRNLHSAIVDALQKLCSNSGGTRRTDGSVEIASPHRFGQQRTSSLMSFQKLS